MAGASDKARFYLEQSVPELQELIRKKIFTKEEVASIAKKRSTFEHKLNARGSTASDYARYAEYETNLDALRRKRSTRMGVKATSYTGQRRVFSVLDRATRKFHGDIGLWLQLLAFARKQKANKKTTQIITDMLRLHPTSPELWVYAADHAMDERGDVTEARSYMQRGLRFCSGSKHLWSEYLKLEMIYLVKIMARRHILGLDATASKRHKAPKDEAPDADMVPLALVTTEDVVSEQHTLNTARVEASEHRFAATPALTGAIPIVIFNSALSKFPGDAVFGAHMFDVVAEFHQLQCTQRILQHIVHTLMTAAPASPATMNCFIREPAVGLGATSTLLPGGLITVLDRFDSTVQKLERLDKPFEKIRTRAKVSRNMMQWIMPYLDTLELDPDIRAVLTSMIQTAWGHCLSEMEFETATELAKVGAETITVLEMLRLRGFNDLVESGIKPARKIWPDEPRLLALEVSNA
ncbi:MAG: hypothetical protein Q9207_000345 [Kuettlingeria erythrocarpa]